MKHRSCSSFTAYTTRITTRAVSRTIPPRPWVSLTQFEVLSLGFRSPGSCRQKQQRPSETNRRLSASAVLEAPWGRCSSDGGGGGDPGRIQLFPKAPGWWAVGSECQWPQGPGNRPPGCHSLLLAGTGPPGSGGRDSTHLSPSGLAKLSLPWTPKDMCYEMNTLLCSAGDGVAVPGVAWRVCTECLHRGDWKLRIGILTCFRQVTGRRMRIRTLESLPPPRAPPPQGPL